MKFCPLVPEICRGQVVPWKERKKVEETLMLITSKWIMIEI
jgi:hypothetical protein